MEGQTSEFLSRTNMDTLQPPLEFEFPFTPYEIQKDFMKNLYQVIEDRKIGVFESPTGTGKSMSIICGMVTWLRDNDVRIKEHLEKVLKTSQNPSQKFTSSVDDEPFWVSEFVQKKSVSDEAEQAKVHLDRIKILRNNIQRIRKGVDRVATEEANKKWMKYAKRKALAEEDETTRVLKRAKLLIGDDLSSSEDMDEVDRDILLEEYFSEEEDIKITKTEDQKETRNHALQKVYYCSRTHSQLSQFIKEIQKSPFVQKVSDTSDEFFLSVVPLASRHSMCINESVRKLPSIQQVNDRCLEMQKNVKKTDVDKEEEVISKSKRKKKSSSSTCPYYKAQRKIEDLSEVILGKVQDIEDIVSAGRELEGCPYYAVRRALPSAQLIVLPYQTLLYGPAREASGIDLKDAIVIVDEAHNLVDTLSNIHSVQVSYCQIAKAHNQLEQYVSRFSRKLKAKNLMYVKQIVFVLKNLLYVLEDKGKLTATKRSKSSSAEEVKTTLMSIHNFLFASNLDNINLYKILRYCQRSQISKKLNGFVEKYETAGGSLPKESSALTRFLNSAKKDQENKNNKTEEKSPAPIMRSPLMHIESFLASLTSANEDGRVAVKVSCFDEHEKSRESSSIKFLLLNVAEHFKQVLHECRSVVVAGGTMQPSSSFLNELILPSGISTTRIHEFSCGHVISEDQLLPVVLSSGPSGMEFEFTFEKRRNLKLIDELGRTLCNLCNIIPGGIICFFPSYDYERMVHEQWENGGLLSRIGVKKKIFREPKNANQVDAILSQYSSCIEKSKNGKSTITGSLLLSVVGGKMSEGINFSDDLGRCIVMVGLPYPNLHSAELKEKMAYLDAHMPRAGAKPTGQMYYESLCMKAVNQSIGRAIRHRNDHACIVLVDHRYKRANIVSQLPGWIADKIQITEKFGPTFSQIRKFFLAKKNLMS